MNLKLTINKVDLHQRNGNGPRGPYTIHEQDAMLEFPNGERSKVRIRLQTPANGAPTPLKAGTYTPGPDAIYRRGFDYVLSMASSAWVPA